MKFVQILKFLVIVLVLSSVIPKRVKRTKNLYMMAKQAEGLTYCTTNNKSYKQWLNIYTDTILNAKSGFVLRNYYKEDFNCPSLVRIDNRESRTTYFVPFRNFNTYRNSYVKENSMWKMRQLIVFLRYSTLTINFDKKVLTDDVNEKENIKLNNELISRRDSYLTTYKNLRDKLSAIQVLAEDLTRTKQININTENELKAEITKREQEIVSLQKTVKKLKQDAETSKLTIRNLQKSEQSIANNEMKPAQNELDSLFNMMTALEDQLKENGKKIQGVVPIDQNDLAQSMTDLRKYLTLYQNTFLESDPHFLEISEVIANLDTKLGMIPTILQ